MAFVWKHKILASFAVLVAIVLTSIAWAESAGIRGRLAAGNDLKDGKLVVLGYGLPPVWRGGYAKILHERYGVEFKAVAGCTVSQSLIDYVDSYNAVSVAAIKKKFRRDVFLEAAGEAEREWIRKDTAGLRPAGIPKKIFWYSPTRQAAECFRSLPRPISMYNVADRCGRADEEIGNATYIFVYHLDDNSTVEIETPYLEEVQKITIKSPIKH